MTYLTLTSSLHSMLYTTLIVLLNSLVILTSIFFIFLTFRPEFKLGNSAKRAIHWLMVLNIVWRASDAAEAFYVDRLESFEWIVLAFLDSIGSLVVCYVHFLYQLRIIKVFLPTLPRWVTILTRFFVALVSLLFGVSLLGWSYESIQPGQTLIPLVILSFLSLTLSATIFVYEIFQCSIILQWLGQISKKSERPMNDMVSRMKWILVTMICCDIIGNSLLALFLFTTNRLTLSILVIYTSSTSLVSVHTFLTIFFNYLMQSSLFDDLMKHETTQRTTQEPSKIIKLVNREQKLSESTLQVPRSNPTNTLA